MVPGTMSEPVEVEVKLGVSAPTAVRRLLRNPVPARLAGFDALGPAHVVDVDDRYLDTQAEGGRLGAALMRARVRQVGATFTVTVKRAGVEDRGVTTRVELEGPATGSLDPADWPPSAAQAALVEAAGAARLHEIARLRQHRLTILLKRADTTVELSLDTLEAIAHGRIAARRHELEAELVEGDVAALEALAEALRGIIGVGPSLGSKLRFALEAAAAR
jgi:inorganic triphosphatase YgiF